MLVPILIKAYQISRLRRRCKAERAIVLTYDDGPGSRLTATLLDILHERNARATFFLIGRKVDERRGVIARIIHDGHRLGSHSYRHLHAWKHDPIRVFLDINRGINSVRSVAECRLFRAPYGKLTLGSLLQAWMQGCVQSWWTIDSTDTWDPPKAIDQVIERVRREGGGVVLMHDMDRSGMPGREQYVLDMTRALLDLAQRENFRICRFEEVLKV